MKLGARRKSRTSRSRRESGAAPRGRCRAAAPRGRLREGRIAAGVLALSAVAGALLTDRVVPVPRVRSLQVVGDTRLSDSEVARAAGVTPGDALWTVDAATVAGRLAAHPWVRDAHAARLPTGHLVLAIEEREPRAVLAGAPPHVVDSEGTPFAPVAEDAFPELPRLSSARPVAPDEPSPALAAGVQLAERLAGLGLPPAEEVAIGAETDPRGCVLRLRGLPPRFVLGRDVDAALPRLARLVASGPPQVLLAATVDLRFQDQAVLSHEPPREGSAKAADPRSIAGPSGGRRSG